MSESAGRHRTVLESLCNLPTAPFRETAIITWLNTWAKSLGDSVTIHDDPAGNLHVEYCPGTKTDTPLVIEAHMDHPGFVVVESLPDNRVQAKFRGGVKPSHFTDASARFWFEGESRWIPAKVLDVTKSKDGLDVTLSCEEQLPSGTIGMWDLPDVAVRDNLLSARVCDDLGGVAAIVCLIEQLFAEDIDAHVIGLFTRAEEVGFAGVLAVCLNGWIPKGSRVIGLETSKASANAPQNAGAIIRVGDRTGLFSPGLTHFLTQAAGHVSDADPTFKFQRRLMDGGTCNSTAFTAFGYDASAMCVALGNYHNMTVAGEIGWGDGAKAGPGIASETIHLNDFAGMVRILVETAKRIASYKPDFGEMRERLTKLHNEEHLPLLYETARAISTTGRDD